jgi:ADP-ribose pyrophosphatase
MGKKYHKEDYSLASMYSNLFVGHRRDALFFLYGVIATIAASLIYNTVVTSTASGGIQTAKFAIAVDTNLREEIPVPMLQFPEAPWRTPQTLAVRTVTSTPFARFEIHKVRTENGQIVNDWLWTDERAHVNILVHLEEENKFLLFHQKKYGLEKAYYATVGGLFEKTDTPESCARRELLEETGLEAKELIGLGKYRVQVNRGGGILHVFYAKNCVKSKMKKFSDDYEKQAKKLLTKEELLQVILAGEIGEAQWLATAAISMLHEDYDKKLPAPSSSLLHPPLNPSPPSSSSNPK